MSKKIISKLGVGDKAGRLTIIEVIPSSRKNKTRRKAKCLCDCGIEHTADYYEIKYQRARSCGCLAKELLITHGGAHTPEYAIWQSMKARCLIKTSQDYYLYGARGITVCDRWLRFQNFIKDMGDRPSPKHSIDRIDNNGNYEPCNCRWATAKQQRSNTRQPDANKNKCIRCGELFKTNPCRDSKYCSWKCRYPVAHKNCITCGLEYRAKPSKINGSKYCSRKCYYQSRRYGLIKGG